MPETVPVRRQRRGEQRIVEILDAASVVFARAGVAMATTNAIAAEAGVSPGSLYQYFSDKFVIADALGDRYAEQVSLAHQAAFAGVDPVSAPLPETIAHIVGPIASFESNHPAFLPLFARVDLPASMAAPLARTEQAFVDRVTSILHARNPSAAPGTVQRAAEISVALFKGVLASGVPTEVVVSESTLAITGYLERKQLG